MRRVVLYHAGCYDGFGAAWAAWRRFGADATYRPVRYGGPMPLIPLLDVAEVYIVDFSYPRPVLEELHAKLEAVPGAILRVLDHHKTAQADLAGLPFCLFDMDKSGARLAWEYFHPDSEVPTILRYVEDRDLWRFALPASREAAVFLRAEPFDFARWEEVALQFDMRFETIAADGAAMLRLQQHEVDAMCQHVVWLDIGGHCVPAANATVFFSEVGERLCELYSDAPFAAYWMDRGDGKRQWGLRSRGGFDVSAVAKLHGGGGHAAAAGWVESAPTIGWLGTVAP